MSAGTEAIVLEYALNAAWQVPLLAGTAWLFVRAARLGPLAEHRLWLGVLAACVLLPMRGVERVVVPATVAAPMVAQSVSVNLAPVTDEHGSAAVVLPEELPKQPATLHTRIGELRLSERSMRLWAGLYSSVVGLALLRLGRGWVAAHRLLGASGRYAMDEAEAKLWAGLGERMHVRLPRVRVSREIESPVVLGVCRPVLLLPEAFAQCEEGERRAALCHELAHLSRHDCLTNALCQWLGVPLVWHPVMHGVQTQIARTREMVCDAVAAREMSPSAGDGRMAYAYCLLGLARRMLGDTNPSSYADQGLGLFKSNKLEERVMRLTDVKQAMSTGKVWMRRATGAAAMMTALAGAAVFHLRPVLAEVTPAVLVTSNELTSPASIPAQHTPPPASQMSAPPQAPAAAQAPEAPIAPESPVAPVAPVAPALPEPAPAPLAPPIPALPALPVAPFAPLPTPKSLPSPMPLPTPMPAMPAAPFTPLPAPNSLPSPMQMLTPVPAPRFERFGGAIEHGSGAHVIVKDGDHVHRWIGADGQPFELVNGQAAELTSQQKRDAEAEYARETANAQKEIEKVRRQLDSPKFKAQMRQLTDGKIQEEMARAQKQVAEQMARMNSPEWKAQMDQLTSGKIQEQMAKLQEQMAQATARMNSPEARAQRQKQIDEAMAKVNSPEFQKQIEEASQRVKSIDTVGMAKQMAKVQEQIKQVNSPEFKRQMQQAQKQVDEAMQQLKRDQENLQKDKQQ